MIIALVLVAVGIALLVIGLLGGAFNFSGTTMPKVSSSGRKITLLVGALLVIAGLALILVPRIASLAVVGPG